MGLAALLLGTAIAYLWHITVNGMGNDFYAAAAWSGAQNWKAMLFGSLDPGNFITVDKPPVSQWVMGLSGQIFGFGSASMLVPQALMAVAAVALLCAMVTEATVNRAAGLLAGAVLAATPVVALMFRFNNPDAVMVLLMTAGAYCTLRAARQASARWLPPLRWTLAVTSLAVAFGLLAAAVPAGSRRVRTGAVSVLVIVGALAGIGGTTAYAAATLPQAHTGGSPTVGPAPPAGLDPANDARREVTAFVDEEVQPQLAALLRDTSTTWSAAVDRSSVAASLELASHTPVMAIGGFTSDDPVPTLADFQTMVRTHQVTYYLAQEVRLPDTWRVRDEPAGTGRTAAPDSGWWRPTGHADIAEWVSAHYTAVHIGNVAVYDLTAPACEDAGSPLPAACAR